MPITNAIRAELIGADTARALGLVVTAVTPVLALCRALLAAGHHHTAPLRAFRGRTLCITVKAIGAGAGLVVKTAGNGAPIFAADAAPRGAGGSCIASVGKSNGVDTGIGTNAPARRTEIAPCPH